LPVDPTTAQLPAGVADQARQALSNVVAVVETEAIATRQHEQLSARAFMERAQM
jgi:enamine deaminase RidA (YjgF/YER057c/UK114 family)